MQPFSLQACLDGEGADPPFVVLPDLEEGVLATLVAQRLDQVAVNLGGKLVREIVVVVLIILAVVSGWLTLAS